MTKITCMLLDIASKSKLEFRNRNKHITVRTYGEPHAQLFEKKIWPVCYLNRNLNYLHKQCGDSNDALLSVRHCLNVDLSNFALTTKMSNKC